LTLSNLAWSSGWPGIAAQIFGGTPILFVRSFREVFSFGSVRGFGWQSGAGVDRSSHRLKLQMRTMLYSSRDWRGHSAFGRSPAERRRCPLPSGSCVGASETIMQKRFGSAKLRSRGSAQCCHGISRSNVLEIKRFDSRDLSFPYIVVIRC